MDTFWIFVIVVVMATAVYVFSVIVGNALERWRDDAGVEPPRRGRRISPRRSAAGLACVIFGSAFGAGFIVLGGAWIAVGAALCVLAIASGVAIFKTGKELPPPPAPPEAPKHAGLAYFWHCWLPVRMLDFSPRARARVRLAAGCDRPARVRALVGRRGGRRAERGRLGRACEGQAQDRSAPRAVPAR